MIQKSINLLALRALQCKRILDSVGYLLLFVFIIVGIGIGLSAFANALLWDKWWSLIGFLGFYISIEKIRKDKLFLKSVFISRTNLALYLGLEYTLVSLPLVIAQFSFGNFYVAISILCTAMLSGYVATFLGNDIKSEVKSEVKIIPLTYFELKFAVESAPISYLIFWLIGFLSFMHIGVFLFWIFMVIISIQNIFMAFETRDMLHWRPSFVWCKFLLYAKVFTIITFIPTLLAFIFHFEDWPILVYGISCMYVSLLLALAFKYASYSPMRAIGQTSTIASIFVIFMVIPGGVLISLAYGMIKYFKAENNIKSLYA
jgi:hypothetical protein